MATYDHEDFLVSDAVTAPEASPLLIPGDAPAGIGLDTQDPAPVFDLGAPTPAMSPGAQRTDSRRAAIDAMGPGQKFLTALGEVGAGLQGRSSPLDAQLRRDKEDKLLKLQEFKVHADALQDGIKMARQFQGDARKDFIEKYATQLEIVKPGFGETFRTLAKQPDGSSVLLAHAAKSPTLKRALDAGGPEAVTRLLSSPEALKTINAEIDSGLMPGILRKGQAFKMGWQQLVPQEMADRFNKDGRITASELMEANEWIKTNKPDMKAIALTDEEIQVIGRNADAFYGAVGILSPKDEAAVQKERALDKPLSEIGKIRADIKAGRIGEQEGEAKIAKLTKQGGDGDTRLTPATISVNGKNIAALVDKAGNYYDANTRQRIAGGIGPQISEADERRGRELAGRGDAVASLEKDVNALEKISKNHPRSAAGLFSGPAGAIEYVAGSLNPGGKGSTPATTAVQLRDSILQRSSSLSRMSNEDRKRMENALQVGSGGNPRNLPLAIQILRDGIAKEKAQLEAPRPRGKGGKAPAEMTDDELLESLSGGKRSDAGRSGLPESYWTMTAQAGGGTRTDVSTDLTTDHEIALGEEIGAYWEGVRQQKDQNSRELNRSGVARPDPGQPTPMQQHQAFLDHVSARFHNAMEWKEKNGTLKGSRYSQEDIDKAVRVFGDFILKDYRDSKKKRR